MKVNNQLTFHSNLMVIDWEIEINCFHFYEILMRKHQRTTTPVDIQNAVEKD